MTAVTPPLDHAQRALFDRLRAMLAGTPVVVASAPPRCGLRTVAAALERELSFGQHGAQLAVLADDTPGDTDLRRALLAGAARALVVMSSPALPRPEALQAALALADDLGALPDPDRAADLAHRTSVLAPALAALERTAPALAAAWEDLVDPLTDPPPELTTAARAHAASVAALRAALTGRVLRVDPPPPAAASAHALDPSGDAELAHDLTIRIALELSGSGTALPGGSYSALLSGDEGRDARRRLRASPRGAATLELLAHVLDESADPDHPELATLLAHALDAAQAGEKLLAVCASPTTARRLAALLSERLTPAKPVPDHAALTADRVLWSTLWALGPAAAFRPADLRLTSDELPELAHLALSRSPDPDPAFLIRAADHLVARRLLRRLPRTVAANPLLECLAAPTYLAPPAHSPAPALVEDLLATFTESRLKSVVTGSASTADRMHSSPGAFLGDRPLDRDPAAPPADEAARALARLHGALWELTDPDDLAPRTRAHAALAAAFATHAAPRDRFLPAAAAHAEDLATGRLALDEMPPPPPPAVALVDARTPAPAAQRLLAAFATPGAPLVLVLTAPPRARAPLHRHCRHLAIQGAADSDAVDPADLARLLDAPGALTHREPARPLRANAPYLTGTGGLERLAARALARQVARVPGLAATPRVRLPDALLATLIPDLS